MRRNSNFQKKLVAGSAFLGFLAVLLGAFGTHGLKKIVTPAMLVIFETGCRYQMVHVLAGLALAGLTNFLSEKSLRAVVICWGAGTLIFSGSLYLLVLTGRHFWGMVTPFGGILLMLGWFWLTVGALKKNGDDND